MMLKVAISSLLLPQFGQAQQLSVFGHKAPDTDAITSALVYAWELNERKIPATPFRLGELNPETEYVLKTLGVEAPPLLGKLQEKAQVAIVDTNNPEELPEGIEKAVIHSIVDHHKLTKGLSSAGPLEIDMRPICSATSILYSRAKAAGLTIPKHIAGLMLSGLLSDSLGFRSPTTTDIDRKHAEELGALAGLDPKAHVDAMLEAKAAIGHLSPAELVTMDSKVFTIGSKKVRVSVLETTKPSVPMAKMSELKEAMKLKQSEEKLDDVLLFVVDILNEASSVITYSESGASLIEKAWKVKASSDGTYFLPGVLSRKKQMIPVLQKTAESIEL